MVLGEPLPVGLKQLNLGGSPTPDGSPTLLSAPALQRASLLSSGLHTSISPAAHPGLDGTAWGGSCHFGHSWEWGSCIGPRGYDPEMLPAAPEPDVVHSDKNPEPWVDSLPGGLHSRGSSSCRCCCSCPGFWLSASAGICGRGCCRG